MCHNIIRIGRCDSCRTCQRTESFTTLPISLSLFLSLSLTQPLTPAHTLTLSGMVDPTAEQFVHWLPRLLDVLNNIITKYHSPTVALGRSRICFILHQFSSKILCTYSTFVLYTLQLHTVALGDVIVFVFVFA